MYELRHLRAFVAVAEEQHFGRAAARLHLSQPTVSVTVRDLERLLGVQLLHRPPRPVTPTPAGEVLLTEARGILSAATDLTRKATELGEDAQGTFVVGLHDEGAAELTLPILSAFAAAEPGVRIVVETLDYVTGHSWLADGRVDAVLSGATWSDAYDLATLFHDGRGVLVGAGHPLYDATSLRFEDVVDEPLFFLEEQDLNAERFFERYWFGDHRNGESGNRSGRTVQRVGELILQIALGKCSNASSASTQRFTPLGSVRYIPVEDVSPVPITVAIPGASASRLQRTFLRVARETADALRDKLVPSAVSEDGTPLLGRTG